MDHVLGLPDPSSVTNVFLHCSSVLVTIESIISTDLLILIHQKKLFHAVVVLSACETATVGDSVTSVFSAVEPVVNSTAVIVTKVLSVLGPAVVYGGRVLRSSSLELLSDEELLCLCL